MATLTLCAIPGPFQCRRSSRLGRPYADSVRHVHNKRDIIQRGSSRSIVHYTASQLGALISSL